MENLTKPDIFENEWKKIREKKKNKAKRNKQFKAMTLISIMFLTVFVNIFRPDLNFTQAEDQESNAPEFIDVKLTSEEENIHILTEVEDDSKVDSVWVETKNTSQTRIYTLKSSNKYYSTKIPDISYLSVTIYAKDIYGNINKEELYTTVSSNSPDIEISSTFHDFGDTEVISLGNNSINKYVNIVVKNKGGSFLSVNIENEYSWLNLSEDYFNVWPGGLHSFNVYFNPQRGTDYTGSLKIYSNDPDRPKINLVMRGDGIAPKATLSDQSFYFGDVNVSSNASYDLQIKNEGSTDLDITTLSLPEYISLSEQNFTISSDHQKTIEVTFIPTEADYYEDLILFETNDPLNSIMYIDVSGFGIKSDLIVTGDEIDLGDMFFNQTIDFLIPIANNGNEKLNVDLTDTNLPSWLNLYGDVEFNVMPGEEKYVRVEVNPDKYGKLSGYFNFTTNDVNNINKSIKIEVDVYSSELHLSADNLDFGKLYIPSNDTQSFEVINTGNYPLHAHFVLPNSTVYNISEEDITLDPMKKKTISVNFNPIDHIDYNAPLKIINNDPTEKNAKINLIGVGLASEINISTKKLNMENNVLGYTNIWNDTCNNDTDVTIQNLGNINLSFNLTQKPYWLEITNESGSPININDNIVIENESKKNLTFIFLPDYFGDFEGLVEFETNDPYNPIQNISTDGFGHSPVLAYERNIDFGGMNYDVWNWTNFTVENLGTRPLWVNWTNSTNENLSVANNDIPIPDEINDTIAPNDYYDFNVTHFIPDGDWSENMTFITDDPANPIFNVTANGTGYFPIPVFSPNITFVDTLVESQGSSYELIFNNTGSMFLNVTLIKCSEFLELDKTSIIVAKNGGINSTTVTFKPKTHKTYSGYIKFSTNAPDRVAVVKTEGLGLGPELEVDSSLSFGEKKVDKGEKTKTLTIKNKGNINLSVDIAPLSDGVFSTDTTSFNITPNGEKSISISFDPDSIGYKANYLTISTNDPYSHVKLIKILGTGLGSKINVPDSSISVNCFADEEVTVRIPIQNIGNSKLEDFEIKNKDSGLEINYPNYISGFSTRYFDVTYKPSSRDIGSDTKEFTIESNSLDGKFPKISITFKVKKPIASPKETSHDYGKEDYGSTEDWETTIKNNGNFNLVLALSSLPNFVEVYHGDKKLQTSDTLKISPGTKITIKFKFKFAKDGTLDGYVKFRTNDPLRSTLSFYLKGKGEKGFWDSLKDGLKKIASTLSSAIGRAGKYAYDAYKESFEATIDAATEVGDQIVASSRVALEKTAATIENSVNEMLDIIEENSYIADEIYNTIATSTKFLKSMQDKLSNELNAMLKVLQDAKRFLDFIKEIMMHINNIQSYVNDDKPTDVAWECLSISFDTAGFIASNSPDGTSLSKYSGAISCTWVPPIRNIVEDNEKEGIIGIANVLAVGATKVDADTTEGKILKTILNHTNGQVVGAALDGDIINATLISLSQDSVFCKDLLQDYNSDDDQNFSEFMYGYVSDAISKKVSSIILNNLDDILIEVAKHTATKIAPPYGIAISGAIILGYTALREKYVKDIASAIGKYVADQYSDDFANNMDSGSESIMQEMVFNTIQEYKDDRIANNISG